MRITQKQINAVLTLVGPASWQKKAIALVVVLAALWALFGTRAGGAGEIVGRVVSVSDGDTITVLAAGNVSEKVRFAYVDAPEKAQARGMAAKFALSAQIFGREVKVNVVEKDRYGRSVGVVWLNGQDINFAQVVAGHAWHYTAYAKTQSRADFSRYEAAQQAAKSAGKGVWQDANPMPPWEFRREKRIVGG